MIPSFTYIFLTFWDLGSPMDSTCPDCNAVLKVGVQVVDKVLATYYAHCYRCGFDLKLPREINEDYFDEDDEFNLWGFLDTI